LEEQHNKDADHLMQKSKKFGFSNAKKAKLQKFKANHVKKCKSFKQIM